MVRPATVEEERNGDAGTVTAMHPPGAGTRLLGRGAGSRRGVDRFEPDPGPQRGGLGIGQLGVEGVVLALASGARPTASVTSRSGGTAR